MELPASKEGFKMQEQMKITWRYIWAVGGIIKLITAKCHDEILHCSVWVGVVTNHPNIPAKHAMSLILDRVSQFLCVTTPALIVES